jgi:beta-galactosidase
VWVRVREQAGTVRLTAKHPRLGSQTVTIDMAPAMEESV